MAMLAWIIPVLEGVDAPHPEHPIVIPPTPPGEQPPEGTTPPAHPAHPIFLPGFPAHPIVLPPEQPPSGGAPPHPAHPIYLPEFPTHPIVIPPTPPTEPPSGGPPGQVTNPINKPPTDDPHWQLVFVPGVGWFWAWVPDGSDASKPHPEPYKKGK